MKNKIFSRIPTSTILTIAALICFAPIDAQARGHSTTVNGARGGTYQRQVERSAGNVTANAAATLPNGKTATRSLSSQKTDTGRTTNAQATGFNGKTATYDSTRTKTDTGYVRQANATGPNGGTASKQVDVSKDNGTVTRNVTTTKTKPPKS